MPVENFIRYPEPGETVYVALDEEDPGWLSQGEVLEVKLVEALHDSEHRTALNHESAEVVLEVDGELFIVSSDDLSVHPDSWPPCVDLVDLFEGTSFREQQRKLRDRFTFALAWVVLREHLIAASDGFDSDPTSNEVLTLPLSKLDDVSSENVAA